MTYPAGTMHGEYVRHSVSDVGGLTVIVHMCMQANIERKHAEKQAPVDCLPANKILKSNIMYVGHFLLKNILLDQ